MGESVRACDCVLLCNTLQERDSQSGGAFRLALS